MTSTRTSTFARTVIALAFALLIASATAQADTNWTPAEIRNILAFDLDGVASPCPEIPEDDGLMRASCFTLLSSANHVKFLAEDFVWRMGDVRWSGVWQADDQTMGRSFRAENRVGTEDAFAIFVQTLDSFLTRVWIVPQ